MDTQSIISPHKTTVEKLSTPFSPESSVVSAKSCIENLPASVVAREQSIRPARNLNLFLLTDLETWKIDRIYSHLWFAGGRLLRARSLHRYSVSRRQVVITESPSEHLVSDYSVIFIKPLPEYLLSHEFWDHHLSDDKSLHSAACGLLLSYTWLIAYKTDFNMARDLSLLPEGLTWDAWTRFANSFLDHLEASDTQLISQRYLYGELRMSRLNYIYKIIPALWSNDKPLRGFMPTSMWNKSFLERNVARLLGLFASFSLILSAMQVGLSTSQLQEDADFVNASYGFAVTSLFIVLLAAGVSLIILLWNVRYNIILPWTMGLKEMRGHDF